MLNKETCLHIVISNDIDGVLLHAPAPRKTKKRLQFENFSIPSKNEAALPKFAGYGFLLEMFLRWGHAIRSVKKDALLGLRVLQDFISSVESDQSIKISLVTTSGREKYLHNMTKRKIAKQFPHTFAEESIRLNPHYGSGSWKELVARNEAEKGHLFIHIEDDLEAALQVARTDESQVLVLLISNESNDETLLRKNNPPISLPSNVIRVESYLDATKKILHFIEQRRLEFQAQLTSIPA